MKIHINPDIKEWEAIAERPHKDLQELKSTVQGVLDDVKKRGDEAVKDYELKFDKVSLTALKVKEEDIESAFNSISDDLRSALLLAHEDIEKFHAAQKFNGESVETAKGVICWQKSVPIEKVGLYIPGGTAPLFSTVLMLATPAKLAGCKEIVLCTPPDKEGNVNPAILAAAKIAGVSQIFKIGGVQAIAAMAYGTESVPKVYKIFGPGNQYVMAAKQEVSIQDVAIDMPAGPSEVCVIADDTSHVDFVAADLLSQAEHGRDSQVLLITTSESLLESVKAEVDKQLAVLPRKEIAQAALENSHFVLVGNLDEAIRLSNFYAPEHLIIEVDDFASLVDKIENAGSVFLGHYATESAGDYASGTNHTLPTSGYARAYSGVNLDSYNRKITFQQLSKQGVMSIGKAVEQMAQSEQLIAHRNAMTLRIRSLEEE